VQVRKRVFSDLQGDSTILTGERKDEELDIVGIAAARKQPWFPSIFVYI